MKRKKRRISKSLKAVLDKHTEYLIGDKRDYQNLRADLSGKDLHNLDLSDMNLSDADMSNADLRFTNFYGANLRNANFIGADLRFANLGNSNLSGANLSGADLYNARFHGANLNYTVFAGAKNVPFISSNCPSNGSFIGYKKAKGKVVDLFVPESASRMSLSDKLCRCDKAKVLGIYDLNHNLLEDKVVSSDRDRRFVYKVGEEIVIPDFDKNRWTKNPNGIYFFLTFADAVAY